MSEIPAGWEHVSLYAFTNGTSINYNTDIPNNAFTPDKTGIADSTLAAPDIIYQSAAYSGGSNPMTITVGGYTANQTLTLRFHLCEGYLSAAVNDRRANYSSNGITHLTDFSISETAGGTGKAVIRDFAITADGSGNLTISSITRPSASSYNSIISGVEIIDSTTPTPTPPHDTTRTRRCGWIDRN